MIDLLSCDALREWTFGYTAERRRDIDAAAARTRAVRQNRGLATCLSILMVFLGTLHSAMADLASPAYITTFGPPWPTFDIETLVYRNRTWQIPKQPTTERWFLWSQVPGCMDSSYVYTCPQERQLALTFDDGPCPFTNRLLDELNAVGAKATFCLIGRQFPGFEDVVRRIAYEGHDLCIHTTSHPHLTELSSSAIIDEIMDTMLAFEQVLGVVPRYFRPPFGEVDLRVKAILDQLNLTMLRWNYDSYDYLRDTDQLMSRYKTYITRDGPSTSWMALQHDLHDTTVAMQQEIVRYARSQGFNVTTPSQCLNMTRWVTGELPLRSASWWTSATARSASQPTRTATLKGLGGGVASLYGDGELRTTRTTLVGSTSGPVTLTIVSDDSFTTSSLAESTNTMSNIGASPTATKKYSLESLIPAGADSSTKRALFVPLLLILFAVLL